MTDTEELYNDFIEKIKEIDFESYSPLSDDFTSVLFIGLMYDTLVRIKRINDCIFDRIQEEIDGAKYYFQKYNDTNDEAYRHIGLDEMQHAEILIHKTEVKSPEDKMMLNCKIELLNELKKLNY